MKEFVLTALKIIAPASVVLVMFAQGLKISPGQVTRYFRERPWLMLRSLVAVLVLVPAAALGIILLLHPSIEIAIALAILVSCPPAPMMIKTVPSIGEGNAAYMASLHLSLAALAFLTVPIILSLVSIPLGFQAEVNLTKMGMVLGQTILGPLILGMTVRSFFPKFAEKVGPKLDTTGAIGLLIVLLVAAVVLVPWLLKMDAWSYLVIISVSAAALAIGHFFGPADARERVVLAVESGVRHPALAITIAVQNFSREKALPILIPCVLVFIFCAVLYLLWQRRNLSVAKTA